MAHAEGVDVRELPFGRLTGLRDPVVKSLPVVDRLQVDHQTPLTAETRAEDDPRPDHSRQAAFKRPSCWSAVTPSSRPTSSAILPFSTRSTVVPVNRILRPDAAGREPIRKSLNAGPVCVPPPSHRPTTESPSAIRSAAPQKLRSGNAARNPSMKLRTSSRP